MKLLAGSLNVEVDTFLHAGYLSSGGRSFDLMGGYESERVTTKLIDVKRSLELEETGPPGDQTAQLITAETPSPAPTAALPSLAGGGLFVVTVLLFFGCLAIYYSHCLRDGNRRRWFTPSFIALPLLLVAIATIGVYNVLPTYEAYQWQDRPPPWAGVPRQQYKDPEAATEAIMHALVANALPGSRINVQQLGAIRHEVAFPLPAERWTPGMTYAAKTYGIDGWGREFLCQRLPEGRYRLASAGPDGEHGTGDDILLVTSLTNTYDWERSVNGVYVRWMEEDYTYFVHHVAHADFRWIRRAAAREVTGTDLFDIVRARTELEGIELEGIEKNPVAARLESHRESHDDPVDPDLLYFVQITRSDDA